MLLPNIAADILPPALVALPIFIVIKMPTNVFIAAGISAVAIVILRKTWYANILDWPAEEIAREKPCHKGLRSKHLSNVQGWSLAKTVHQKVTTI
jgi:hypothetical protein